MDFYSPDPFWGLFLFFLGTVILSVCSSIERENHHRMKALRTLSWYGRRKIDSHATLLYKVPGSILSLSGGILSIAGLIILIQSINWVKF